MRRLLYGIIVLVMISLTAPLSVAAQSSQSAPQSVYITPTEAPRETDFTLQFAGFRPGESLAVWINRPDGRVVPINAVINDMHPERYEVQADRNGAASAEIFLDATFPAGAYSVVARGNLSERQAVVAFRLRADPWVTLTVTRQQQNGAPVVVVSGSGFVGRESVSLWLTNPDRSVRDLGRVRTRDGSFSFRFAQPEQRGTYTVTAYAPNSRRSGTVSFLVNR